jgi:hypothetical protein
MEILQTGPGKHLKSAKEYLLDAVIDERLQIGDRNAAKQMITDWWEDADRRKP